MASLLPAQRGSDVMNGRCDHLTVDQMLPVCGCLRVLAGVGVTLLSSLSVGFVDSRHEQTNYWLEMALLGLALLKSLS